jgi:hypothetical protein
MFDIDDLRLIKEEDIYLVPLCLLAIFVFAYTVRSKYNKSEIQKYFFPALFIKFFFAIVFALVIDFYYGEGDTRMYYQATLDLQKAVTDDLSYLREIYGTGKLDKNSGLVSYFMYDRIGVTHYYMYDIKNYMVPKFALPFSVISFKSYLCICFFLGLYSFAGCWRIFKVFYSMYPHLHKKLAIACLFLPSVLFWSSSLLKDSICLGSFGFAFHAAYNIAIRKDKIIASLPVLIVTGLILFYIKPYVLLCAVPAFMFWLFIRYSKVIKDKTLRSVATLLFSIISLGVAFLLIQSLTSSEIASQYSTENLFKSVQSQHTSFSYLKGTGSNFTLGDFDNSIVGFVKLFPVGLVATLFRPFLWESGSVFMFFSGVEAFGFTLLTLLCFWRVGFSETFRIIFSDPVIIFCFVYSILFAGLIGMTTYNFGALARYKIPCIPIYLTMLFIVMDKSGKFSPNIVFSKKFF